MSSLKWRSFLPGYDLKEMISVGASHVTLSSNRFVSGQWFFSLQTWCKHFILLLLKYYVNTKAPNNVDFLCRFQFVDVKSKVLLLYEKWVNVTT